MSAAALAGANTNDDGAAEPTPEITTDPLGEQLPEFTDYLPAELQPAWETISHYPALQGLIIAVLFFVLAYIVRSLVIRTLSGLASRSTTTLDDEIITYLRRPLFLAIFFFGLTLAAKTADLPGGTEFIVNGLLSLIIVSWISALMNISSILLTALGSQKGRMNIIEERTIPILDLVFKILILLVGSYTLLLVWGINPVGWLASAGIVGIALGFAAKDTLANLFSGFFILADAPYRQLENCQRVGWPAHKNARSAKRRGRLR